MPLLLLSPRASISALSHRFDWALHAHAADRNGRPMALQMSVYIASNPSDQRRRSPMFQGGRPIEHEPVEMPSCPLETGDGRRTAALPRLSHTARPHSFFFPASV